MEQDNFTVLENKAIGRNISIYRKMRGMKASEVAESLGMKESTYTRYERGESEITVNIIRQVAETLKVDPLTILSVTPSNFIENSPNSAVGSNNNWHNTNEEHTKIMLKLMENLVTLNERLISLLDKKEK